MTSHFSRIDDAVRRSAWSVWLLAVGVYFFGMVHRASLGVAGPDAVARWDISATELGSFIMVQLGVYAAMQVPAGVAIDRFGPRRVLLVATVTMGTAQLLFAFATAYPVALLARALLGVGDAAVFIAVLRLVAGWFPRRRYALLTMATGLVGMLGNFAATVPLVLALGTLGWTRTFLITGGISVAYALLLLRPAVAAPFRTDPGPITAAAAEPEARGTLGSAWSRRENRLGFFLHQSTMTAGTVVSLIWGYPYLTEGLGYDDAAAASLLSVYVLGNLVASLVIGPLAGRKPQWRTALGLGVALTCIAGIATLVLWPGGRPPVVVIAAVFALLATGVPGSQIGFHLARDYNTPRSMSTATGVVNSGGFLASMVVAIVVGVVLDLSAGGSSATLTDYRWALASMALAGMVTTTAMVLTLLGVRARVLERMAADLPVLVPATERIWDRAWRRLTSAGG
ncbi:MFS transporter [Ruania zhangjianzhongii]|uniref:MFS transporter n=1 Tax=Ruania zhangjianzhongii TaxID=2603206 RepID=UPI0011CADE46|nr:MFS transporter [Ruania zhangjianzhongii]